MPTASQQIPMVISLALTYEWKNEKGEVVEHDSPNVPPSLAGNWHRVFSFGISSVNGAGGSPSRVAPVSGKRSSS